jgi:NAD(P)-dependent dehydrogenase (short-subunit alcohol dehydrogenase family)
VNKLNEEHKDDNTEVLVKKVGIRKDFLMMWMGDSCWHDVINTNLNGFFYFTRAFLVSRDKNENELKSMIPLNRFGLPEEVAEVVCFPSSKKSSYLTGEVISINGGLFA